LIAEAQALGAAPTLRVDAVKALQQRWQEEAHAVVLDRKQEQKLWDAFRQPIDEAFARKSSVREQSQVALTPHDKAVLDAAKALDSATAKGDAAAIRAAMQTLDQIARGEVVATGPAPAPVAAEAVAAPETEVSADAAPAVEAVDTANEGSSPASEDAAEAVSEEPAAEAPPLPNLKPHHALWWPCAVMTARAKNAPKPHLRVVVAMASPAVNLATSQALAETANLVAKALRRVAHVWGMRHSVPSAMRWNRRKMRCAAWPRKRTVKC